jgi:hypothetical protein
MMSKDFVLVGDPKICTTYNGRIGRDLLIGKAVTASKFVITAC